jgi:hypothetical protein
MYSLMCYYIFKPNSPSAKSLYLVSKFGAFKAAFTLLATEEDDLNLDE